MSTLKPGDRHPSNQHSELFISNNSNDQQQLQKQSAIKSKDQYTCIGSIFGPELLVMRVCGGTMFDVNKLLGLLYRVIVVLMTRFLEYEIFINIKSMTNKFEAIATLNVRIMLMVYQLSTAITLVCTIITGLKYHNLLMVILKKRLDKRYISVIHGTFPFWPTCAFDARPSLRQSPLKRKLRSRVNQLRILLLLNLLSTVVTTYCRDRIFLSNESNLIVRTKAPASKPGNATTLSQQSSKAPIFSFDLYQFDKSNEMHMIVRELFWLGLESLRAAINIYQIYGTMLVNFFITAVLTEMLNFSANHDGILHERSRATEIYLVDERGRQYNAGGQSRRGKLLTSELLVQVRDVLLTLGRIMNTNHLLIMIYDVSRLMSVFCLFTAALSDPRIGSSSLLMVDYVRVSFSILFSRLGYFWLHAEVRNIKHALAENRLLTDDKYNGDYNFSKDKSNGFDSSAESILRERKLNHQHVANHAEVITSYRLADQIENMWPTDWFKPDIKNYLSQNIFVITFVATLQQLVEAASAKTEPT